MLQKNAHKYMKMEKNVGSLSCVVISMVTALQNLPSACVSPSPRWRYTRLSPLFPSLSIVQESSNIFILSSLSLLNSGILCLFLFFPLPVTSCFKSIEALPETYLFFFIDFYLFFFLSVCMEAATEKIFFLFLFLCLPFAKKIWEREYK